MFESACLKVRESLYGILCQTDVGGRPVHFGSGTGFLIAPQLCLTAAHVLHHDGQKNAPIHSRIQVIRAPEVGQPMRMARLLGIDDALDLALLQIEHVRPIEQIRPIEQAKRIDQTGLTADQRTAVPAAQQKDIPELALHTEVPELGLHAEVPYLTLHAEVPLPGTPCGSLGYPLSTVGMKEQHVAFTLIERFQGSYISSRRPELLSDGRLANIVETDGLMYGGSSGCPGFTTDGRVWGLHFATITENVRATPAPQQPQTRTEQLPATPSSGARLAISLWVSSTEIRAFAARCG
ncbi:MAG: serine protease, partial [Bacteroidota bacterium]